MLIERVIRLLGVDQVAHQQRDAVGFRANARRQGCRFIGGNAKSVHTGVYMERCTAMPFIGRTKRIPFRKFDQTADHGAGADIRKGVCVSRQKPIEHIKRRFRRNGAHAASLGEIGNEKSSTTGTRKRAGDRLYATAIAVGLDHSPALRWHRPAAEFLPVGYDRSQIDSQDTASIGNKPTRFHLASSRGGICRQVGLRGGISLRHEFGFSRPRSASPCDVLYALWQTSFTRKGGKPCYVCIELQLYGAGWPVALLPNNNLSLAVHFVGICEPLRKLFAVGF